ncbi:MAG TPA: hypothetical protein VMZ90_02830, partial [Vicinamibacterales bacterium]|nr:hypothetical protein [Vicinamibacterales bacterium]
MTALRRRISTAFGIGLVVVCAMRTWAQPGQSLAALTVPGDRLPKGCRLEPVDLKATGAARFVMSPGVRQNPWTSTERRNASIRIKVDGPASPTYGLPAGPALHERSAEDVSEYYRARYIAADQQKIDVWAVRFKDPAFTRVAAMARLITDPPQLPRIIVGASAVLVFKF